MNIKISKSYESSSRSSVAPGRILTPAFYKKNIIVTLMISWLVILILKITSEGILKFSLQWTRVSSKSKTNVILSYKAWLYSFFLLSCLGSLGILTFLFFNSCGSTGLKNWAK